jgi:hypothetical protein
MPLKLVSTAANSVPSDDEVIDCQLRSLALVPVVWSVQVAPLSEEVQMSPPRTTAARWVPSDEEVMAVHLRSLALVPVVSLVQVTLEAKAVEAVSAKRAEKIRKKEAERRREKFIKLGWLYDSIRCCWWRRAGEAGLHMLL